ncbi:MAG: sensor histidine kinase [Angelakisella sp.]
MQISQIKKPSLQLRLVGIVLLCWILPVIIIMVVMTDYASSSLNEQTVAAYTDSVQLNAAITGDRLDDAVQASRAVAYSGNVKNDYRDFKRGGSFSELYWSTNDFLRRQYHSDDRFRFAVIWFWDDPTGMSCNTYNSGLGVEYSAVKAYWEQDHAAVTAVTEDLDTGIAFVNCDDRIYMVRNIMSGNLKPIATIVLQLNAQYFFGNFGVLLWQDGTVLHLDDVEVVVSGNTPSVTPQLLSAALETVAYRSDSQGAYIYGKRKGDSYTFYYVVDIGADSHAKQLRAFQAILIGMALILLPLMLFAVRFIYANISKPVEQLVAGAREIELGNFGVQLENTSCNREFSYLESSFNEMSLQLEELFHTIYDEELALRDAKIKALQSQINPHFLNNTLELINWEARMSGSVKVTRMIEALSTMLDAAMARDGRHTVRLSEEMMYVDAYLYIISERLGKRLTITKDIDSSLLSYMVPRLIMQPIIENAVEHGITPRQQGEITLRIRAEDGWLLLQVINDGSMSRENAEQISHLLSGEGERLSSSYSIGIRNVHQRLSMTYGEGSGLTIVAGEDDCVIATIRIPEDRCQEL